MTSLKTTEEGIIQEATVSPADAVEVSMASAVAAVLSENIEWPWRLFSVDKMSSLYPQLSLAKTSRLMLPLTQIGSPEP